MDAFKLGVLVIILLSASLAHAGGGEPSVSKVSCTEIREEPGVPTYGFELVLEDDDTYRARFLSFPGDESLPPTETIGIGGFNCDFRTGDEFLFQCQKAGASVNSVRIHEEVLVLNDDDTRTTEYREFRAVGIDVPDIYQVARFGSAATCHVIQ